MNTDNCTTPIQIGEDLVAWPEFAGPISAVNQSTTQTRWSLLQEATFTYDDAGAIDFSLPFDIKARALRSRSGHAVAIVFSDITFHGIQPLGTTFKDSAGRNWTHLSAMFQVYPTSTKTPGVTEPLFCTYVLTEAVNHMDIRGLIRNEYMRTNQLTLEQNIALEETISQLLTHVGSLPVKPTVADLPF